MPRRSRPTFPIPREDIDDAEQIKGSAQRAILAGEIKRCLEEDDQDDAEAVTAIRGCRSFAEALAMAQEYVIFEVTDGEWTPCRDTGEVATTARAGTRARRSSPCCATARPC